MIEFPNKFQTWNLSSSADGRDFDDEFDQIYTNFQSIESVVDATFEAGEPLTAGKGVHLINEVIKHGAGNIIESQTTTEFIAGRTFTSGKLVALTETQVLGIFQETAPTDQLIAVMFIVTGDNIVIGNIFEGFNSSAGVSTFTVAALTADRALVAYDNLVCIVVYDGDLTLTKGADNTLISMSISIAIAPYLAISGSNAKALICYRRASAPNTDFGIAVVVTMELVTNTIITVSSEVIFNSASTDAIDCKKISLFNAASNAINRVLVTFVDFNGDGKTCIFDIVSVGTIITVSANTGFSNKTVTATSIAVLSKNLSLVAFHNNDNFVIELVLISHGHADTPVIVSKIQITGPGGVFLITSSIPFLIKTLSNNRALLIIEGFSMVVEVRGVDIQLEQFTFIANSESNISLSIISNNKFLTCSTVGTGINSTVNHIATFLGLVQSDVTFEQNGVVTMSGIAKIIPVVALPLEINRDYYLDIAGGFKKLSAEAADLDRFFIRKIGKAISTTEILLNPVNNL